MLAFMKRRDFLTVTSGTMLALAVKPRILAASPASEAASWHMARNFADLPFGRVAYVSKKATLRPRSLSTVGRSMAISGAARLTGSTPSAAALRRIC